ncbi:TIGR01620 family protein [Algibacillus agarilyticus]|uniref:TIGR01620 family protein n=1 Tax=Algibacillus agarilyticus TaxID=2234133 RepID=UPI000DD04C10|nr:TIGR01620 family protein [Algibacillus agarilyticus]
MKTKLASQKTFSTDVHSHEHDNGAHVSSLAPAKSFDQTDNVKRVDVDDEKIAVKPNWLKPYKLVNIWSFLFFNVLCIVIYEWGSFLLTQFTEQPILVGLYSLLMFGLLFGLSRLVITELRALKSLKKQSALQSIALDFEYADRDECIQLCKRHLKSLDEGSLLASSDTFLQQLTHCQHAQDVVQLYNQTVIASLDAQAEKMIAKTSIEVAVVAAISPFALLDLCASAYKQIKLMDAIAKLYGVKFGYLSRLKLLKHIMVNASVIASAELVSDLASDALSVELLGKLSFRVAQGLGAGLLTARIGIRTVHAIRPFALIDSQHQQMNLNRIRKSLLSALTKETKPEQG